MRRFEKLADGLLLKFAKCYTEMGVLVVASSIVQLVGQAPEAIVDQQNPALIINGRFCQQR